jgi:serine protease Do
MYYSRSRWRDPAESLTTCTEFESGAFYGCVISRFLRRRLKLFAYFLEFIMRASNRGFNFKIHVSPIALALSLAFGTSGFTPASAATPSPSSTQSIMDAMSQANAAVVGIRVTAVEGARSAETLGLRRRGSGVVIGPDGLVLTIGYLMLEAQQIEIVTQDNKIVPAVAVGYDVATGFGLVRPLLPMRGVKPATFGSVKDLKAGEPLMAATGATAGGEDGGVSMTQLVSTRAFSGTWEYHIDTALFTSPPVSSGRGNHSGAPLFNQKGELLGIGSLLVMDATGENKRQPGNMFVPVDLLKPILAEMQQSGSSRQSRRPWLGLTSSDSGGRVQIVRVNADSPANLAGLQAGEVVLAVDGTEVKTLEGFYKKLWARSAPDTPISLTVLRGDEVKTVVLKPLDRMQTLKKPSGI